MSLRWEKKYTSSSQIQGCRASERATKRRENVALRDVFYNARRWLSARISRSPSVAIDRWRWREKKLKGRPLGVRRLEEYSSERIPRIPVNSRKFFRSRPRENSLYARATASFPAARETPNAFIHASRRRIGRIFYGTKIGSCRKTPHRD